MTPESIAEEIRAACDDFHRLVDAATTSELRQGSNGTKWTNEQLLFHMLFGYLLVRNLLWLVRGFARLPDSWSRRFAAGLNGASRPFHVINYVGSLGGARVLGPAGMERTMDRVTAVSSSPSSGPASSGWHAACTSPWAGTPTSGTT